MDTVRRPSPQSIKKFSLAERRVDGGSKPDSALSAPCGQFTGRHSQPRSRAAPAFEEDRRASVTDVRVSGAALAPDEAEAPCRNQEAYFGRPWSANLDGDFRRRRRLREEGQDRVANWLRAGIFLALAHLRYSAAIAGSSLVEPS